MGRPIERAEKGAGRDRVADERPHATLVAIAFGDDGGAQPRRQRVHLEVRRRAFDLVDEAQDVCDGEIVEARARRSAHLASGRERLEQPVEGAILAEIEQFVLALEVVIQVARGQVRRGGDVAHAGGGKPDGPERPRGGAEDLQAPRVGAE